MRSFFLIMAALTLTVSSLHSQEFTQDPANTKVDFVIKNAGFNVDGHFDDIQIEANFDEANIKDSYFRGMVAVKSIDTGIKARNKSLQKKKYFDEENHPSLQITSSSIKKISDQQYEFYGSLTIKAITKPINFPFNVEHLDGIMVAKAGFSIDRRDFEVGGNSFIMGNNVKINIVYTGKK